MGDTVNLTSLAEARAKMTPGDYELADHSPESDEGAQYIVLRDRPALIIATMTDHYEHEDDGTGLVAEHNAIGVLVEVARTGRDWVEARDRVVALTFGSVARAAAAKLMNDALDRHRAALAKVSL